MLDVRTVDLWTKPTFLWLSLLTPSICFIITVGIINGDTPLTSVLLAPTHICDRGALLNAQPEGAVIAKFRFLPVGNQNRRIRCQFHDGRTTPHCRRLRDRQFDPRRHPSSSFEAHHCVALLASNHTAAGIGEFHLFEKNIDTFLATSEFHIFSRNCEPFSYSFLFHFSSHHSKMEEGERKEISHGSLAPQEDRTGVSAAHFFTARN